MAEITEWRWKNRSLGKEQRQFAQPLWLGEPIEDKTILLYGEQGMGDIIQFCRYVPMVAARGAKVIVEIDSSLKGLLSSLDGVSHCATRQEPYSLFDLQCPMLSRRWHLARGLTLFRQKCRICARRRGGNGRRSWGRKISRNRHRLVGNPPHVHNRETIHPNECLFAIARCGANLCEFAEKYPPSDLTVLKQRSDLIIFGPLLEDFADTAALISCLDLVISVDTSVVHLAGALAKPFWVLVPFLPTGAGS